MDISMRFVCVGTIVPEQYEVKIASLSNASNRFLLNLTNALCRCGNEVQRFSYIGIPIEQEVKEQLQQDRDSDIQFVWKTRDILKGVINCHREIARKLKEADCLLAYNTVYAWLLAPVLAHRLHKKAILILADYSDTESYAGLMGKIYASFQKWSMRRYDTVIGLSENTEKLLCKKQQFILMEGGISQTFFDAFAAPDTPKQGQTVMMYAGILEKVTGIDILLQAFRAIENPQLCLFISGKGSLEPMVRAAQEEDARIQYLGCPPYEAYIQNLHKADILINPRNMKLPENKNNFPSKIMEYLATGKPVLSTRFPGWERFGDYIHFCDSDESKMREQLMEMIGSYRQEQMENYQRNRVFAEKYIWDEQVRKMIG